jgi:hypothetical protein
MLRGVDALEGMPAKQKEQLRFATRGRAAAALASLRASLSRGAGALLPPTAFVRYWGVGVEAFLSSKDDPDAAEGRSAYARTPAPEGGPRGPAWRSWGTYTEGGSGKELPVQRNAFRDAWDM